MLSIAFVSSEITPYASTGGLADVCGSLPSALCRLGAEVTQFMPMYRRVMEGKYPVEDTGIRLSIPVGFHRYQADIWRLVTASSPHIYFIRRDEFFDRTELYNLPDRDYDDNFERFIYYQKAVVALIDHLGKPVDIVHGHDWQTGLVPLYLQHGLSGEGRNRKEKTVFTIHNLAFQGIFSGDNFSYTNLPFSSFSVDNLEYYGNVNSLKGGITASDIVTTVSETYAREIQTKDWGCGLDGVLRSTKNRLRGITNGIDIESWNPATDRQLVANYDVQRLSLKNDCKLDLLKRMKLSGAKSDTLLVGMVTRLTEQKGFDELEQVLDPMMKDQNIALVLLGAGSDDVVARVKKWEFRYPGRMSVKIGYDAKLSHRIMAGSDLFLMPSKFEPCGLNQLYGMRYGTLPLVHRVGGLADTVTGIEASPSEGFGFVFDHFTPDSFMRSMQRAVDLYRDREKWKWAQQRAMSQDHSWERSAKEYLKLYAELCPGSKT